MNTIYKIGDKVKLKSIEQLLEEGWVYDSMDNTYVDPNHSYLHILSNMFPLLGTSATIKEVFGEIWDKTGPYKIHQTFRFYEYDFYWWKDLICPNDPLLQILNDIKNDIGL